MRAGIVLWDMRIMMRDFIMGSVAGSYICPHSIRKLIYNLFGNHIKTNRISPHVFVGGNKLFVGENTFINYNCFFDTTQSIHIGNNVCIGMGCYIITGTHQIGNHEKRGGMGIAKSVEIGDGCWIGGNVTILPGVSVGSGTVIGAGSIVIRDCDSDSVYAGVPAVKIKSLPFKGGK